MESLKITDYETGLKDLINSYFSSYSELDATLSKKTQQRFLNRTYENLVWVTYVDDFVDLKEYEFTSGTLDIFDENFIYLGSLLLSTSVLTTLDLSRLNVTVGICKALTLKFNTKAATKFINLLVKTVPSQSLFNSFRQAYNNFYAKISPLEVRVQVPLEYLNDYVFNFYTLPTNVYKAFLTKDFIILDSRTVLTALDEYETNAIIYLSTPSYIVCEAVNKTTGRKLYLQLSGHTNAASGLEFLQGLNIVDTVVFKQTAAQSTLREVSILDTVETTLNRQEGTLSLFVEIPELSFVEQDLLEEQGFTHVTPDFSTVRELGNIIMPGVNLLGNYLNSGLVSSDSNLVAELDDVSISISYLDIEEGSMDSNETNLERVRFEESTLIYINLEVLDESVTTASTQLLTAPYNVVVRPLNLQDSFRIHEIINLTLRPRNYTYSMMGRVHDRMLSQEVIRLFQFYGLLLISLESITSSLEEITFVEN